MCEYADVRIANDSRIKKQAANLRISQSAN